VEKLNKTKKVTTDDLAMMVAKGFENMVTKDSLELFKFDTNNHFNNLETDMKSVKKDLFELKEKVDDIHDTVMGYDKRIEVLESQG